MERLRSFYLSLGSNIQPARNLAEAIRRLRTYGAVREISSVWESHAVGSTGPDFLNVCVRFEAGADQDEVKRRIVDTVESGMGRARTENKNAPRTIDIDIVMADDQPVNPERWEHAFVVVPMAELLPHVPHPASHRPLVDEAERARASTWIRRRPDVLTNSDELEEI